MEEARGVFYNGVVHDVLGRFYLFRGLGLTWLYVPFQWFYLRAQGLSATELMALNTVFCVAAVVFEVPTGALADRLGRRVMLVTGAMASALSCLVFLWLSASLATLALANVLAALAMTCVSGADSAYLYELLRWGGRGGAAYRRAESFSTGLRLAMTALGAVAGAAMVAQGLGLEALYVVTALLAASGAMLALTLPEPWREAGAEPGRASTTRQVVSEVAAHGRRATRLVAGRRDLCALLLFSAVLFPVLRVGLFLDQPFVQRLGFDTSSLGVIYGAKDLVAAGAAAVSVFLIARLGELRVLTALPLVVASGLVLMSIAEGRGAVALVLLPTMAFGVFSPLVRVYINSRLPSTGERATVLSIEGMARRFGFALFSPLVGAAVDLWSLSAAMLMSAAWALVAVVLVWALPFDRTSRPAPARQPTGMPPRADKEKQPGPVAVGS